MTLSEADVRSILPAFALIAGALLAAGADAFFSRDKRSPASEFLSYLAIVVSLITVVLALLRPEGAIEPQRPSQAVRSRSGTSHREPLLVHVV